MVKTDIAEGHPLSEMGLGKLKTTMHTTGTLSFNSLDKLASRHILGFNIRPEILKLLEESLNKILQDIDTGNVFSR